MNLEFRGLMKTFTSLPELLLYLQIGRTTYFKLKKQGTIQVEESLIGGKRLYTLQVFDQPTEGSHKQYKTAWINWRESGLNIRPWSATYKTIQLHYIEKYFADFRGVTAKNLESWLEKVPASSLSKRRHCHRAVSSYARYLQSKGLLDREEYLRIKALYPKKSPYYQLNQRIIYEQELTKLLDTANTAHSRYQRTLNHSLMVFLAESALRVSEACGLKLDDLKFSSNPQQAFIRVRCGKGGKFRLVPFSSKAQRATKEYMQKRPNSDSPFVFLSFNPVCGYQPMDRHSAARRFQNISRKAGVPFSAHSLRHYRITAWANNARIPITVVQKWAGHSSLEITQQYVHIRDEDALLAAFN
jgi:integrase